MQKKGFKWKSVKNDPDTGKRFQIMQMMRPVGLALDAGKQQERKIVAKREPIMIKAGVILRLFKDVYTDNTERSGSTNKIEVPYCLMSALLKLKNDKQISNLESDNATHPLVSAVDAIPREIQLLGVRAQISADKDTAFTEINS